MPVDYVSFIAIHVSDLERALRRVEEAPGCGILTVGVVWGRAASEDGVRWRKTGPVHAGAADWNHAVVCDPTVVIEEGEVRLWYGGGDTASPDERLNGAVGEVTFGR